jgi:hypothetical protein
MFENPKKELEAMLRGEGSRKLLNEWEPFIFIANDPVNQYLRENRVEGKMTIDRFGVTFAWPKGQISGMSYVTDENKVIKDITHWRDQLKIPDLRANCTDWSECLKEKENADREKKMTMCYMANGIFEQLHDLMGFEDTLLNMILEPEAMKDLCEAIGDYRLTFAKLLVENFKPDIILSHDDWGSKTNLFMSPEAFRDIIKPQYEKLYRYLRQEGILIMHHADSYCEPIVDDMVELGIDIWQGVLPQNNIPEIQKKLNGKMLLMGGIDASIVDRENSTEEEIRKEVRRACEEYGPAGGFIPSMTYGGPDCCLYPHVEQYVTDEIEKYNQSIS